MTFFRSDEANKLLMLHFDKPERLSQITVIGYNHSAIVFIKPAVVQEMDLKIDIRAFFFGLDISTNLWLWVGLAKGAETT